MLSHAANPIAEPLYDHVFRIYFSCRDKDSRSHISFIEVDIRPPFKILKIADHPLLTPGEIGAFDDSGVSLSCLKQIRGRKYLYYLGWNLGVTVPWRNSIGMAIHDPESDTFQRVSKAPLMDRNEVDPFSLSYPFVLEDEGTFRMWYGSNLKWGKHQEEMAHVIKYAESADGFEWIRKGKVALTFKNAGEYAISRPHVLKESGLYKMWYSFRGKGYRIGYAESHNGVDWQRKDEEAGIDVSQEGWDSETIEYPFVFDHDNRRYLLYNGNGYGKTGIGLAVLDRT